MYKIAVIGTGYVGLTAAIGLANFGSTVLGLDIDAAKIELLKQGKMPIYEPGMQDLLDKNVAERRLVFSQDIESGIRWADIIFIGVGSPQGEDGRADLTALYNVAEIIGRNLDGYVIVVTKSTVPVGTNEKIYEIINEYNQGNFEFDVVSNPEFLREGKAMYDFLHPDRVVIGTKNPRPVEALKKIYRPLYLNEVPFIFTDLPTAEMIKYASNCFLAAKVAFINEMARVCDSVGANVQTVALTMGRDGRIGPKFLHPGPGYGGSCFPKDTQALAAIARDHNIATPLVDSTIQSNVFHKEYIVQKVVEAFDGKISGKRIAVLGLAFKAETDDIREASSLTIINRLLNQDAAVCVYDPQAMDNARQIWSDVIEYAGNEYEAIKGADGVVLLTEWNQFRNLDVAAMLDLMADKKFFDFRNIYQRNEVEALGAEYYGIGT
ncbi:udp-glucose/gdp-mannose dehydrogenase dimerisation [Lucifera butyrica]|uniref:UDP-glucose 6-dehydrogenase n=1 Tax=Lucifera butyrica TaxID=1351585 RepID=A0A498R9M9_9FIRM|nr:UDP-glucose/GDP-mannose dehydrogenase family protein [Lucifera butyrica]VBB09406.1 udp-glucose/gdp-mannose dehydrogenase dimerisation [Lucifera butyrica]